MKDSVEFNENISPICLTDAKMEDLPKCSDFSLDEGEGMVCENHSQQSSYLFL